MVRIRYFAFGAFLITEVFAKYAVRNTRARVWWRGGNIGKNHTHTSDNAQNLHTDAFGWSGGDSAAAAFSGTWVDGEDGLRFLLLSNFGDIRHVAMYITFGVSAINERCRPHGVNVATSAPLSHRAYAPS